uniref:Uncharacterized protein n=1 Tax=Vitis vinifera TaxID=29760 RepID=A5AS96_VITVI|nr:hypothetical protein VITISV_014456 [Vitis vinifera]
MAHASHLALAIQGRTYREASGETPLHYAKWLRNSPGKRCQRIQICLTGEVETPSSPIRRQAPDAKYPNGMSVEKIPDVKHPGGMSTEQNSRCDTSWWNVRCHTLQGGRLRVQGVGIPPPDDTEHASLSGATPSGFSKRICGALPYPEQLHPDSGFVYGKGLQSFGSSCF